MIKLLLLFCLSVLASGQSQKLVPTTTLAAETGNNTSAASSFAGWANGVPAPGNVSKVPLPTLLPTGAAGVKIYAEYQSWWGKPGQPSVGYSSLDPVQEEATVKDMISRGVNGLIDDWYGQGGWDDKVMLSFMKVMEKHPGFEFAIMEDKGAVVFNSCAGCDPTAAVISHLNYVAKTYYGSPNYMRFNGRPVVFLFALEGFPIDWAKVRASVPGNPLLLQYGPSTITNAVYDGAYSWLATQTTNYAAYESLPYLDNYYSLSAAHPNRIVMGSVFKGFNDIVAPWAPPGGRHISQLCGQTWLDTWAHAGKYIIGASPFRSIQLVTWNDYQEGSELETGIDNCASVSSTVSASQMATWILSGNVNTIDHFTVFISQDGQSLTKLTDVPADARSLDLAPYILSPGSYQVFVKAVGKPNLFNHMSQPALLTIAVPLPPVIPPVVVITVTGQDAVLASPVEVQARATAGSVPISAMALYLDGVLQFKGNGASLDRWICAASGSHVFTVNTWDTGGKVTKLSQAVVLP